MEALMAQALSYCTTKLFSHAVLPLVMIKPQPVANANDDNPLGPCPSIPVRMIARDRRVP
jgi:hypothetical protein